MTIQDKIVNYCQENGIEVKFKPVNNGFLLGVCRIDRGCKFTIDQGVNWDNQNDVSLILHELGHLLSVPKEHRASLTSRLQGVYLRVRRPPRVLPFVPEAGDTACLLPWHLWL